MVSTEIMVPHASKHDVDIEDNLEDKDHSKSVLVDKNILKIDKRSDRGDSNSHTHTTSYHSSSNSDSNLGSPRHDSVSSSTTSLDENYGTPAINNKINIGNTDGSVTHSNTNSNNITDTTTTNSNNNSNNINNNINKNNNNNNNSNNNNNIITKQQHSIKEMDDDVNSILVTNSIIETESYLQDINDDSVLLNNVVSRTSTLTSNPRQSINSDHYENPTFEKKANKNIPNNSLKSEIRPRSNPSHTISPSISKPTNNRRRSTLDSSRKALPFQSSKHAHILPVDEITNEYLPKNKNYGFPKNNNSLYSLQLPPAQTKIDNVNDRITGINNTLSPNDNITEESEYTPIKKFISTSQIYKNDGMKKKSESAAVEIKKMRETLLRNREEKSKKLKQGTSSKNEVPTDEDRVLIGRRVSEGHVNFIIAYNMLTGIRVAVSRCSGIMKPLVPMDFKLTKKLAFDYHGNELTPSSQYAFKFKDYAPEVFRELRALFGLDPADYLVSLTSKYILSELDSPGKSGSFFYYSRDYKYIIKTIHHAEHRHLRKHIQEYYDHVKNNPNTLLCQFYGLHRIKMPITFQNKLKHRRIYFLVMNNLFPPNLDMHLTFDLKGSTWGRYTQVDQEKVDTVPTYRPVLKDLNWLDNHEHISFGPLKRQEFLTQLMKDVKLLSKLNTMDYSLLIGIHDVKREREELKKQQELLNEENADNKELISNKPPLKQRSSMIEHYFKQDEGGLKGSDENDNDIELIYFIGIIDCLTNYSIIKRLETFWRGLNHDLKVVSAIPPRDYSDRFYKFISNSIDTSEAKQYRDDPNSKPYKDIK